MEEMLSDVETKISASRGEQITGKQVYQFLLEFDKIYGKMTKLEKRNYNVCEGDDKMSHSFATWISPEFQLYIMKDFGGS